MSGKTIALAGAAVVAAVSATGCTNDSAKTTFVLATYNVRCHYGEGEPGTHNWKERAPRWGRVVAKNKMDIIGTQEALVYQLKDMIRVTGFDYIGGGRDDFKEGGEYSCILYNPERFELLKDGTFALSETPDIPGSRSWDSACPRIATWGHFRDKNTGKEFVYYNTHLDHISEEARINGIRMVVDHAKEHVTGVPLILSGDFNAYPNSETYRIAASLLKDSAKITLTPHVGPSQTFNGYGKNTNNDPIDYIFVSDGVTVKSHVTDDTMPDGCYASDHFPVVTEIELN